MVSNQGAIKELLNAIVGADLSVHPKRADTQVRLYKEYPVDCDLVSEGRMGWNG